MGSVALARRETLQICTDWPDTVAGKANNDASLKTVTTARSDIAEPAISPLDNLHLDEASPIG